MMKLTKGFKPSLKMQAVLNAAIDFDSEGTVSDWCRKAGVSRQSYYDWRGIEGFQEWWDGEWEKAMKRYRAYLDRIGLEKAKTDFRYWEAMQKKYGGMEREGKGLNVVFNIPRPSERLVIDADQE